MNLNNINLRHFEGKIRLPRYNRSLVKTGILHVGVGNFHRSHMAFFTDEILHHDNQSAWGICGVCLLETDRKMYGVLKEQNGLYTLIVKHPDGNISGRVIGSITDCLFAPENPEKVIAKLADPDTKIVSLTITEGGYNFDASTGEFLVDDPLIKHDLKHPKNPVTIFGYLAASISKRIENRSPGFTILSCDNLPHNGDVCKKMLTAFLEISQPGLIEWINDQISFPNTMVDRITPATRKNDIDTVASLYGIDDRWPVVCEPFIQWIIEDNFKNGRPDWEINGVQFVTDVSSYERMKIRLLNAGHTLLGMTGSLHGYDTIDQTVADPLYRSLFRKFMDEEVTPTLGTIQGINLEEYKNDLVTRFGNPAIRDGVARICSESSAKVPKFLLPTVSDQLLSGKKVKISALVIAAWCRYLERAGTRGFTDEIQDAMKEELIKNARASVTGDPLAFLKIKTVFGNVYESEIFTHQYLHFITQLREKNIDEVVRKILAEKD